jgi:hypothetical protein
LEPLVSIWAVKARRSMATRSLCAINLLTVCFQVVISAKEFVDAIASIRVKLKVQPGKAPIDIGIVVDVRVGQPSAEKIDEFVRFKASSCQVRSAEQLDAACVTPARGEEVE